MRCPRSWGFSRGSPRRQHVARDPTCRQNMEKGGGSCYRSERQVLGPDLTGRVSRGKASGLEAWSEDLQDDSMRLKILPAGRTWKRTAGAALRSEWQVLGSDLTGRFSQGMTSGDFPRISKTAACGSRSHLQAEHGRGWRELLLDLMRCPRSWGFSRGSPRRQHAVQDPTCRCGSCSRSERRFIEFGLEEQFSK